MSTFDTISGWLTSLPEEGDRIKLLPSKEEIRIAAEKAGKEKQREVEKKDSCSTKEQHQSSTRTTGLNFSAGFQAHFDKRKDRVRSYLNNLTVEEKKAFLKVKLKDLKIHLDPFGSDTEKSATAILTDALKCVETKKKWCDCKCYDCSEEFVDTKPFIQHTLQKHIGNLILPEAKPLLPKKEWIDLLLHDPSSKKGASAEMLDLDRRIYMEACDIIALIKIEEKDSGGEEDRNQASNSDFLVAFDSNSSLLLLDERKLANGGDIEGFLNSLVDNIEDRKFSDTCEALTTWSNRINEAGKPWPLFRSVEEELALIKNILERKCEHLNYMKELFDTGKRYAEENLSAEGDIGFVENYWGVIRKQRYELFEVGDEMVFRENRFKMEVLSNILRDAESQVPDSKDRFPRPVFARQLHKAQEELEKITARIKSKLDHMEQVLYEKLPVDYEAILFTLVKSYIRKWLEDSAEIKGFRTVYGAAQAAALRLLVAEVKTQAQALLSSIAAPEDNSQLDDSKPD